MKFAIATVAFWEALGYDTANWRKSNDGNQAITELKYAEILGVNLAENPEVKIYFGDSPKLLGLLESAAWHRDGTNGPFDSYNLLEQLAEVDTRLTTAVAEVIDGEAERVAAEDAREVTYNALVADVQANVDAFDVALEDGIVAENLAVKLAEKETTYAPRLTAAEQQLEQAATKAALAVEKSRIDNFTTLASGSTTGDAELIDVRISADGTVYKNAGGSIRGQISQLVKIPENKWTYGNRKKLYTTGQTWVYQDFELFELSKGKAYKIQISDVENHPNVDGLGRFICFDASNKEIAGVSVVTTGTWYELPISENTAKVIFRIQTLKGVPASINGTAKYNGIVVRDSSDKITLDGDIYIPQLDGESETYESFLKKSVEVLNNGESILLEDNNILKNKILIFKSRLSSGSFNAVMLGHGKQGFGANYAIVDSSTIKIYSYTTSIVLLNTFNHGLNIENFISIFIAVGNSGKASIKLISSNGMYSSDEFSWSGCNGAIFAESVNSVLTNCQLTWDCQDYEKPIYAFGDSYFSMGYEARWPYYINQFGYDNWLVDSFAGRKSTEGYRSLLLSLEHGTPKHILWCLGMNDADTATEINVDWKNTITTLINLCDSKRIELILATIPNVPTRNNSFKNAWIENSGYRYVDFNKAVGGDLNPNWYIGMLSGDGVHPDILGAQALASQALIDFPELCH